MSKHEYYNSAGFQRNNHTSTLTDYSSDQTFASYTFTTETYTIYTPVNTSKPCVDYASFSIYWINTLGTSWPLISSIRSMPVGSCYCLDLIRSAIISSYGSLLLPISLIMIHFWSQTVNYPPFLYTLLWLYVNSLAREGTIWPHSLI